MSFLRSFDFNHNTGYSSVVLVSIAIALLIFSLVYMSEGLGWLAGHEDEALDIYLDVGWNWIRGSGVAFVVAVVFSGISVMLLRKNHHSPHRRPPLFGKLDVNQWKGLLGFVSLSVAFVFFFNAVLYRMESNDWFYGAVASGRAWYLSEASSWATGSYVMSLIGIFLAAAGWILIALQWQRGKSR